MEPEAAFQKTATRLMAVMVAAESAGYRISRTGVSTNPPPAPTSVPNAPTAKPRSTSAANVATVNKVKPSWRVSDARRSEAGDDDLASRVAAVQVVEGFGDLIELVPTIDYGRDASVSQHRGQRVEVGSAHPGDVDDDSRPPPIARTRIPARCRRTRSIPPRPCISAETPRQRRCRRG